MIEDKKTQSENRKARLLEIIKAHDMEQPYGCLSREEISFAMENCAELQQIISYAGVRNEDLSVLLDVFQQESENGEVSYERLANVIHDIESVDLRKIAVINNVCNRHREVVQDNLQRAQAETLARIERKIDALTTKPHIKSEGKIDALTTKPNGLLTNDAPLEALCSDLKAAAPRPEADGQRA